MSHPAQHDYVKLIKSKFPEFFRDKKVLEVGSYNVNGSVREHFTNCEYIGIDMMKGNDVDIVCSGATFMNGEQEVFDVVISCEMFEHNPEWKETFLNMVTLLKPKGLLLFTCATTGRAEHGTIRTNKNDSPSSEFFGNYYRNLTEADFTSICEFDKVFSESAFTALLSPDQTIAKAGASDLQFYGIKL